MKSSNFVSHYVLINFTIVLIKGLWITEFHNKMQEISKNKKSTLNHCYIIHKSKNKIFFIEDQIAWKSFVKL